MSTSLPLNNINNIEGSENFLSPLDPFGSLYEELLEITAADHNHEGEVSNYDNLNSINDELIGFKSMKIVTSPKSFITRKKKINRKMNIDEEGASSVAKKQDHNAKERIRRMKINASFLALRALLPHSTTSKKRWGAPAVVDRVVKYIPEMENEVEALRSKKEGLMHESKAKNKVQDIQIPKFSFNKINEEEAVIQICMGRKDYEDGLVLMRLMQSVEDDDDEGISINSVSAIHISQTIICCHLHLQISNATFGVEQLRDKIISWLR